MICDDIKFYYHLATYCINLTIAYAHITKTAQIAPYTNQFLYFSTPFQSLLAAIIYHNQHRIITIVKTVQTIYVVANNTS